MLAALLQADPVQIPRDTRVPGAVRLHNGIILEGICLRTSDLFPEYGNEQVAHRSIDQQFRRYYVPRTRSQAIVPDPSVLPSLVFRIPRKRGHRRIPDAIGVPNLSPVSPEGLASARLVLQNGKTEHVSLGVTEIDRDRVELTGLTHRWTFSMALSSVPETSLYPGLLEQVEGFDDGLVRLNIAGMLIEAGRVRPAERLLTDLRSGFPDLLPQIEQQTEKLQQQIATRVLDELRLRQQVGQPGRAAAAARIFPQIELTAAAQVALQNLIRSHEDRMRRVTQAAVSLQTTVDAIEDGQRRQQARDMTTALIRELDIHSVSRLDAWEFLADDETVSPEEKVALAVSGWLLGPDEAIQQFTDTFGLLQIRRLVRDYVLTEADEQAQRDELLQSIRAQEGFSVARTAAIIRHMPPPRPLTLKPTSGGAAHFELTEESLGIRCLGRVPPDFSSVWHYPLLLVVPRQGVSLEDTLAWWSVPADRFGFIVAAAAFLPPDSENYAGTAADHRHCLDLIRTLKLGLPVNDNRLFIAGHGTGGDVAMDMASSHCELFAGVISIAGTGRRHVLRTAHNSADMGWYVVFGDRQAFWYPRLTPLIKRLFSRVTGAGRPCDALVVRYQNRGFESFYEETPALFEWMQVTERDPWPEAVSAEMLRSTDLSWHWIRFDSLPPSRQTLEQGIDPRSPTEGGGRVRARCLPGGGIHVSQAPSDGVVILSPDLPGFRPDEPFVVRTGRGRQTVEFVPRLRDLLEHYRETGERIRQCHMQVRFRHR